LKLVILTTNTPHHVYFAGEVARNFEVARIFCETDALRAPFDIRHSFETLRDEHECQRWFNGVHRSLPDIAPTGDVASMNEPSAVLALSNMAPDVVMVFGTRRLKAPVLAVLPRLSLNLHGGDPEEYRGLDTHLWAVYHRDFAGLVTTLHMLTPDLDDGAIVSQAEVPLRCGMGLHELRGANTEACVQLALAALSSIETQGNVPIRRQRRRGRYYSFMPTVLKDVCSRHFASHTAKLDEKEPSA
jgi:methionyl-tRNA formyltransferase